MPELMPDAEEIKGPPPYDIEESKSIEGIKVGKRRKLDEHTLD